MKRQNNFYRRVHEWLNRQYGKANKCQSDRCNGKSKTYEYCLRAGMNHEKNISHYITLCRSCHRLYDMTDEKSKNVSKHIAGKYNENLLLGPKAKEREVLLIDENRTFDSGKELAMYLGSSKSAVYMVANGKRKTLYGYKIKYLDANN